MSSLTLRWLRVAVLSCAWLSLPARAIAQEQRAILELIVNVVRSGEALVILRSDDALVDAAALTAHLQGVEGRREIIAGREFVSLGSLAPAVLYDVDEDQLQLRLTADVDLLSRSDRRLSRGAPADLQFRRDTSAFANYSIRYGGGRALDLFTESAVSARGLLFYTSAALGDATRTRGLSNVSLDQRKQMRRWTFGDAFGYSGPLGGDAWIAGLTVAREFAIDPYYVRYPTLSLATPITVPSVMEVQVNGHVVRQEPVQPGRLNVTDLPLTLGRNDARIVVRDAFGGTRELSSTYYLTTSALAPGVHDYQYSVGFRREHIGTESWDYRAPVALARHRVGITNSFTMGGRAELHPGKLVSGGPSFNLRLRIGEIESAAGVSRERGQWGTAALTSFSYVGRRASAGGSMMIASAQYATLTAAAAAERPATQTHVFSSVALAHQVSLSLQHSRSRIHGAASQSRSGIQSTLRLGSRTELSATVSVTRDARGRGREGQLGLTVLFGRASASVAVGADARGRHTAVDAQLPLPAGTGYGVQLRAERGEIDQLTGAAQYQHAHGRYEVRQDSLGDQTQASVNIMGGVVAIGGGLHLTRPVQDSFALVRVPGVEGVRAFASNQEVGRTGRDGELLVPDLHAYYGNTLDIADADIPLEYSVPSVRTTLAPPYRGGALAVFAVRKVQQVVGRVRLRSSGKAGMTTSGELTVTVGSDTFSSPVGSDGAFYFENLSPGRHPAVFESREGKCRIVLEVPSSIAPVVKLGTAECDPRDPR